MKRTYIKIIIDIAMTAAVLALTEPKATGLSLHEWGGLAICLVFLIHNLINWKWIACVTGKFFQKLPAKNRVNYVLDALLLVGFSAITLSGMAIAKTIDFSWLPLGGNMFFLAQPACFGVPAGAGCGGRTRGAALEMGCLPIQKYQKGGRSCLRK